MFVTQDAELHARVLAMSNHGRISSETRQFWPQTIGFKYKISNLQAAIGCAQMERVEELLQAKRRIFNFYLERLEDLDLRMNPEPAGTTNGFWMPTLVVKGNKGFNREALLRDFRDNAIDGRVFFWPLSHLGLFDHRCDTPESNALFANGLNLPSYHDIAEDQMQRVIALVRKHVGH
jgi:perosamine synthetase